MRPTVVRTRSDPVPGMASRRAVHHERADAFDRLALASMPDAVVALCDGDVAVIEQGREHVDRGAGVGVPLGVGMSQRVRHHVAPVDDAVGLAGGAAAASAPGSSRPIRGR